MKYNIGIDLGGTNIKVGLVDENYNIVAKATCKTDQIGRASCRERV